MISPAAGMTVWLLHRDGQDVPVGIGPCTVASHAIRDLVARDASGAFVSYLHRHSRQVYPDQESCNQALKAALKDHAEYHEAMAVVCRNRLELL